MSLAAGTRLGPYEVLGLIGAGGMGEVYKARDTRLDRTVAIKILPAELSADPERRARFEREARAIASLAHPNICTLHDVGTHPSTGSAGSPQAGSGQATLYLVMEHLAGETLAARLRRGPVPLAQALDVAAQIAEALDAAHKHGVIHRDLKPGNVMLTTSGAGRSGVSSAKLLDFGLAKLAAHGEHPALVGDATAPTMTAPVTARGTILGTLQYMAPEQLEGKEADARTDLWALGAILYEMMTGKRAFEGESQVSLIGNIMNVEPAAIATLQPLTPPALERVVKKCLAKHPDDRWDTAHDVADELRWIASAATEASRLVQRAGDRQGVPGLLAVGALAGLLIGAAVAWTLKPPPPTTPAIVTRSELGVQPAERLDAGLPNGSEARTRGGASTALAVSPAGTSFVFVGRHEGVQRLYLRSFGASSATALDGTEGAQNPVFSGDGAWIAFWAGGWLKKVPSSGGSVVPLVAAVAPIGMSWGPDNRIVCGSLGGGLWRVSGDGGAAEPLTRLRSDEVGHRLPHVLATGNWVLFTARKSRWLWGDAEIVVQSLSTGERRVLVENGVDAEYVSTGHLVYMRHGTLMARPFDVEKMTFSGTAVGVVDGISQAITEVSSETATGAGQYAISDAGTLIYIPGGPPQFPQSQLVSVDRSGQVTVLTPQPGAYITAPAVSPDGERLSVAARRTEDCALWLLSRTRGSPIRLTAEGEASWPRWAPDGRRVAFLWRVSGTTNVASLDPERGGLPERLTSAGATASFPPSSWSPDGKVLVVSSRQPDSTYDIELLVPGDRTGTLKPLIKTKYSERNAQFSPDGRWLAYVSDETGRDEVYVQPYPGQGHRIRVSIEGGLAPAWNPNGRELFYVTVSAENSKRWFMSVAFNPDRNAPVGLTRKLFEDTMGMGSNVDIGRVYDVFPDGQRFLAMQPVPDSPSAPVTHIALIEHWFEELKAKVPGGVAR